MEKEFFNSENRFAESKVYQKLQELPPVCFELYLSSLVKVARSANPNELLKMTDTLLGFVSNNEKPEMNKMLIDTTVDELLPILNTRDPETVRDLVADQYSTVLESFDEIRENSDEKIASKCIFGEAILTFPGSEIVDGDLDS